MGSGSVNRGRGLTCLRLLVVMDRSIIEVKLLSGEAHSNFIVG